MNYWVYTRKGEKAPVEIARTKYLHDAIQLLISYKRGFVNDNKGNKVFEKGEPTV